MNYPVDATRIPTQSQRLTQSHPDTNRHARPAAHQNTTPHGHQRKPATWHPTCPVF